MKEDRTAREGLYLLALIAQILAYGFEGIILNLSAAMKQRGEQPSIQRLPPSLLYEVSDLPQKYKL
jgi:hypothetical protein